MIFTLDIITKLRNLAAVVTLLFVSSLAHAVYDSLSVQASTTQASGVSDTENQWHNTVKATGPGLIRVAVKQEGVALRIVPEQVRSLEMCPVEKQA